MTLPTTRMTKIAQWFANHVTPYRMAKGEWRFGIGYASGGFAIVLGRRAIAFHRSLAIDPDPAVTRI